MKFYFDGSEGATDEGSKWLTLAGFAALDNFWSGFNQRWVKMLRARYPIAPYIHMYELLGGDDPFETVNGWTLDRITSLVWDAVTLLQECDEQRFCSFLCTIDVSARDKLVAEGRQIPEPEVICANWCVTKAFTWFSQRHYESVDPMHIFFDRGERFMETIKGPWLKNRTPPGKLVLSSLWWDMIENIEELDMAYHPPIQAADMFAWGRSRILSERDRTFKHLIKILNGVVPSLVLQLNEERLRAAHPLPQQ